MNLYCHPATNFVIVDDSGREYTPEEAREAVTFKRYQRMNVHMMRLVDEFNYDVSAMRRHYQENDRCLA